MEQDLEHIDFRDFSTNFNKLNSRIQILKETDAKSPKLYSLTKHFIICYINTVVNKMNADYDAVDIEIIQSICESFPLNEKLALLKTARRELRNNHHEEEWKDVDGKIGELELAYEWKHKKLRRPLKLFFLVTTYNFYSMITSLVVIPVIVIMFLYPYESPPFPIFIVTSVKIVDSDFWNHFVNSLLMFGGHDGLKIQPVGVLGIIILIVGKVIFLGALFSFLLDKFIKSFTK